MKGIVVYGAGGHGREVAWIVTRLAQRGGQPLACFVEDGASAEGRSLEGTPVLPLDAAAARFPGAGLVVAVGGGRDREAMWARARRLGFRAATLVDPEALCAPTAEIGEGAVLFPGVIVSANARVGAHAHLNLRSTLSHDVVVGDYATLSPGVHVAGRVEIGRGTLLGIGASVVNGAPGKPLRIGDDAVVGAGACVIGDVPPGLTVVGVPARPVARP